MKAPVCLCGLLAWLAGGVLAEDPTTGIGNDELRLAESYFWGNSDVPPSLSKSKQIFERIAKESGHPVAQYYLGFLHGTGHHGTDEGDEGGFGDQGSALLYYTFSALGGYPPAEMTIGHRHWAGIGTPQSCAEALPFYKSAADKAMQRFHSGPPGGRHLPPLKNRISDQSGGVYGPGASVYPGASRLSSQSVVASNPTSAREWQDVLEFYRFNAERNDPGFMFRLGRIFYQGFGGGLFDGPRGQETGGRDFRKALKWFLRLARQVWPRDDEVKTTYSAEKDLKLTVDENRILAAGLAAGYLGKIYLRGESVRPDYGKAFMWFMRGASQGDRESHNSLGIMYRDGIGVQKDMTKAVTFFQTAAQADLPDAQVNLAKFYFSIGELGPATQYFDQAIQHGDLFQSFYYLAEINSQANRPDLCPIAVSFYKTVAERGDWGYDVFWEAERARLRGDDVRALKGYLVLAERGYEVGQNNVAWMLDAYKQRVRIPHLDLEFEGPYNKSDRDRLALTYWTRSAAQDNVDALVKMGDYYYDGIGVIGAEGPQYEQAASCYRSAAGTQMSAISMWNLGWMHENGLGVAKDFHLAKRYYDLALQTSSDAYLPVTLSLIRLYIRGFIGTLLGEQGLPLFGAGDSAAKDPWTFKDEIKRKWEQQQQQHPDVSSHNERGETSGNGAGGGEVNQRRELETAEDPLSWTREAKQREVERARERDDDDEYLLLGEGEGGDLFETFALLGLCVFAGWLIYQRQNRELDGRRREQDAAPPEQPINMQPGQPADELR